MAILRSIPRRMRQASYTGRVMVDSVRGALRVRKWPKKRGPPRSAAQRFWVEWFQQANLLAKYADGMSQVRAKEMTKGSGMYPRDVLLKAMRGRLYTWVDTSGWRWFSVAAIQDISESLDILGQTVGDILVRAVDRWRPPPTGALGDLLTNQGVGAPPTWVAPGGGVVQVQLAESPILPDNTQSQYIFDVSSYLNAQFTFDNVDLQASDTIQWQVSTDGGATYWAGAFSYLGFLVDKVSDNCNFGTTNVLSFGGSATDHMLLLFLENLRAPRSAWHGFGGVLGIKARARNGFFNFDGPITHIKWFLPTGTTFKNGKIHAVGMKGV